VNLNRSARFHQVANRRVFKLLMIRPTREALEPIDRSTVVEPLGRRGYARVKQFHRREHREEVLHAEVAIRSCLDLSTG
jgi:hypothetical protein